MTLTFWSFNITQKLYKSENGAGAPATLLTDTRRRVVSGLHVFITTGKARAKENQFVEFIMNQSDSQR